MQVSEFGSHIHTLSGVRAIMADVAAAVKNAGTGPLYNLSAGNPLLIPEVSSLWERTLIKLIETGEYAEIMSRYGATQGNTDLRRVLASMFNERYAFGVTEDNIVITGGSQALYFMLINCLTGRMPDGHTKKVLFAQAPDYAGYANMGIAKDCMVANLPTIEEIGSHTFKYRIDFGALDLTDIGLVVLSRPCNPSGNVISDTDLRRLIALCEAAGVYIAVDNAYAPPVPNLVYTPMTPMFGKKVIHTMSFSKAGLAGERVGAAICPPEIVDLLVAHMANSCLHSSKLGQAMLADVLANDELQRICEEIVHPLYAAKFALADRCMKASIPDEVPYFAHLSEGGFFRWIWFRDLPIADTELYARLKVKGLIIVPGSSFFPGLSTPWKHATECIRISLAASDSDIEAGFSVLAKEISALYGCKEV